MHVALLNAYQLYRIPFCLVLLRDLAPSCILPTRNLSKLGSTFSHCEISNVPFSTNTDLKVSSRFTQAWYLYVMLNCIPCVLFPLFGTMYHAVLAPWLDLSILPVTSAAPQPDTKDPSVYLISIGNVTTPCQGLRPISWILYKDYLPSWPLPENEILNWGLVSRAVHDGIRSFVCLISNNNEVVWYRHKQHRHSLTDLFISLQVWVCSVQSVI